MPATRTARPARSTGRAAGRLRGSARGSPGGGHRPSAETRSSRPRGLDRLDGLGGRKLDVAPDETAGHAGSLGGARHCAEALLRSCRDADEDLVGARRRDRAVRFVEAADDADAEDAAASDAWVVVEEPDDAGVATLAELTREAATRTSRPHDEYAPPLAATCNDRLRKEAQRETRGADEHGAEDGIDGEDLDSRERADRPQGDEDEVRDDGRPEAADDDGHDVAGRGEPPDAPVHTELDEEDVARPQQDRQRGEVDRTLVVGTRAVHREDVRGEERRADEDEVREH